MGFAASLGFSSFLGGSGLGDGAGDLSLTGVAGVISSSGIERLATAAVTGATVSGAVTW